MEQIDNNQEKKEDEIDRVEVYDEDGVADSINKEVGRVFKRFMPYQRQIMIVGMILLIFLVVFLGYARGGLDVCRSLDGLLDSKFKCHPNYYNEQEQKAIDTANQFYIVSKMFKNES